MNKLISLAVGAVVLVATALTSMAAEVYGPVNPFALNSVALLGTNTTSFTPSAGKTATYAAAQLGFNVPYVTFEVFQTTTNNATSNMVYTISGSIAGTNWTPIATYTLALTGTNAAKGFTNIPPSVYGGYRYLGVTAVQNVATNYATATAKFGFWHTIP